MRKKIYLDSPIFKKDLNKMHWVQIHCLTYAVYKTTYSQLLLSWLHLSGITGYLEVKIWSLITGNKGGGWGGSGVVKVSCVLHHRGIQLILACSWARLAVLVAGKGRGECFYFFCFSPFIPVPLYRWHKMTHKGWHVIKPQHSQSTGNKILWKREIINFSSLPQYFQYICNFWSHIHLWSVFDLFYSILEI